MHDGAGAAVPDAIPAPIVVPGGGQNWWNIFAMLCTQYIGMMLQHFAHPRR